MTARRLLPAALLLAAFATPLGVAPAALAQSPTAVTTAQPTPRLNASGFAEVRRAPDQAEVTLGVAATGKTSTEATDALNRKMAALVAAIKGVNHPGMVVQTQALSLQPQFRQERDFQQTQAPEIIGYTAVSTVRVTTGSVDRTGEIIDAGLKAGSNTIHGVSFSLKNDADAKAEALRLAAQDARTKATTLANALGVTVAYVLEANTDGGNVRPFYRESYGAPMMTMKDAGGAPSVVESGEVVITATVSVAFAITQPGAPKP